MKTLPAKAALLLSTNKGLIKRIHSFLSGLTDNEKMRKYLEAHYRRVLVDGNKAKAAASSQMKKPKLRNTEWYFNIIFGASTQTLRNWVDQISYQTDAQSDDPVLETASGLIESDVLEQQETIARIVSSLTSHRSGIEGIAERFVHSLQIEDFSDQVDVYTFGAKLGFSEMDVQMQIDKQFWKKPRPQFNYFVDKRRAKKYSEDHVGLYLMFHRAPFSSATVLQSTLRIRYTLEVNSGTFIVRCKLHIPRLDDGINISVPYFSYDGYVTDRGDDTFKFWYFEKNKQGLLSKNDMIDLISINVTGRCASAILTSIWTNERSSVYSANAVLIKQNFDKRRDRDTTFSRTFMRAHNRIHGNQEQLENHLATLVNRDDVGLEVADMEFILHELRAPHKSIVITPPDTRSGAAEESIASGVSPY